MAKILVVDDDHVLCSMLVEQLHRKGYVADATGTLQQGLAAAEKGGWDVVLLDVQMPDGNGLEFLPKFLKSNSAPEVIIVTGHGAPDGAEKAIVSGAWSYIEKPHVIRDLPLHLTRALQYREEKQRVNAVPVALKRKHIVGDSEKIWRCLDDLAKAASSEVNTLISGETGTGKEVFARAIHENSDRAKRNFVVVDCASLPESLIENALFGHVKGAFTGADRNKDGLIAHANGGTLFLDEVGELPISMQKAFLRVLQERRYRPLGGAEEKSSDFRLIAASNRDLEEMVTKGSFREDLLYRLRGMLLHLPPLRERKEDIKDLAYYFLHRLCERYDKDTKGIAPDFIEGLLAHDWPGNVRELSQTMEHVFAGAVDAPTLYCIHLPEPFRIRMAQAGMECRLPVSDTKNKKNDDHELLSWRDHKAASEKQYLARLLQESDNNMQQACRLSGLSRARLYQLLGKYDVSNNRSAGGA